MWANPKWAINHPNHCFWCHSDMSKGAYRSRKLRSRFSITRGRDPCPQEVDEKMMHMLMQYQKAEPLERWTYPTAHKAKHIKIKAMSSGVMTGLYLFLVLSFFFLVRWRMLLHILCTTMHACANANKGEGEKPGNHSRTAAGKVGSLRCWLSTYGTPGNWGAEYLGFAAGCHPLR